MLATDKVHGIRYSVFSEKVNIPEYACVPLGEPDVRVEMHLTA